jgi:NADH:ubiquinone oxidoreductase subunit 3 (subunit A)
MDFTNYLPVLLIIVMAVVFAAVNLLASGLLGPKRSGDVKSDTYAYIYAWKKGVFNWD